MHSPPQGFKSIGRRMPQREKVRDEITPRTQLSRTTILNEAMRLVDRDGPSGLTMRALGNALGVEAMSLYHHVHGREELLDGLSEIMVARLPNASPDRPWQDAVRAFATGIRRIALRHPAAFQLVGMRPLATDGVLRPVGTLLTRLRQAGLTAEASVAAYRLIASFARGFALAEIAGFTLGDPAPDRAAIPTELTPFITALSAKHSQAFHAALDIIVDGIAGQAS